MTLHPFIRVEDEFKTLHTYNLTITKKANKIYKIKHKKIKIKKEVWGSTNKRFGSCRDLWDSGIRGKFYYLVTKKD